LRLQKWNNNRLIFPIGLSKGENAWFRGREGGREASFKGVATMAMWPGSIQLFIGGDRILPRLGPN